MGLDQRNHSYFQVPLQLASDHLSSMLHSALRLQDQSLALFLLHYRRPGRLEMPAENFVSWPVF